TPRPVEGATSARACAPASLRLPPISARRGRPSRTWPALLFMTITGDPSTCRRAGLPACPSLSSCLTPLAQIREHRRMQFELARRRVTSTYDHLYCFCMLYVVSYNIQHTTYKTEPEHGNYEAGHPGCSRRPRRRGRQAHPGRSAEEARRR